MIKAMLTFIFSLLISGISAQTTFEKTFNYGIGVSVSPLANGDFVTAINYPLYGIAKIDALGNAISFQNINHSTINTIKQTNDGGFIYSGMNTLTFQAEVTKTDANGVEVWSKNYNPDGFSAMTSSILNLPDNSYIINMSSNGSKTRVPYQIFKLDESGNEIWRISPGDATASSHSLINSPNAIIDAFTTRVADEFGVITLTGIDKTNGSTLWTNFFYDTNLLTNNSYPGYSLEGFSTCVSANNEIFIAGSKTFMTDPMTGTPSQYIIKTDLQGNTIWTKTFGQGSFQHIIQSQDGGLVIIGKDLNTNGLFMMKMNENGDSLWSVNFNKFDRSAACDLKETNDLGFILSGYAFESSTNEYHTYLIKTDQNGHVNSTNNIAAATSTIYDAATLSPTILTTTATIHLPKEALSFSNQVMIMDATGKMVKQVALLNSTTEISKENLSPGIYTAILSSNTSLKKCFKFIVE